VQNQCHLWELTEHCSGQRRAVQVAHRREQVRELQRLLQHHPRRQARRHLRGPRHHDGGEVVQLALRLEVREQLRPRHHRHVQVHHQHAGPTRHLAHVPEGIAPVRRHEDPVARERQGLCDGAALGGLVLDEQHRQPSSLSSQHVPTSLWSPFFGPRERHSGLERPACQGSWKAEGSVLHCGCGLP
jgi:hypothetical protein